MKLGAHSIHRLLVTAIAVSAIAIPSAAGAAADDASHRPDTLVKAKRDTSFVGDGIYNTDASDQTLTIPPRATAAAVIRVENDGTDTDTYVVTVGHALRSMTVKTGGANVTDEVTMGGYRVDVAPGSSVNFAVAIHSSRTSGGRFGFVDLMATSTHDPSVADRVAISVG